MPNAEHLFQKALQFHQSNQFSDARILYEEVLALIPDHLKAIELLALIAKTEFDFTTEVTLRRRLLANVSETAGLRCDLADALLALGDHESAILEYRRAVTLDPSFLDAHCGIGVSLSIRGSFHEAAEAFRHALTIAPMQATLHFNLGSVLRDMSDLENAATSLQKAVDIAPEVFDFQTNLGNVLLDLGRTANALRCLQKAVSLRPDSPEALTNLGNAFAELNQLEYAEKLARKAISIQPEAAEPHNNLGGLLLRMGRFAEGWRELEWRWRQKHFSSPVRQFTQPQWTGGDLAGRTILIHAEQGMGDTLQFCRYIPLVADRGGRVIFECPKALQRLLRGIRGVERWLEFGEPLPVFDSHCPLMSLPLAFGTTETNIPAIPDNIVALPEAVATWGERLERLGPGLRVGIAWAGNPIQANDRLRSMPFAALAPLADIQGVHFFSLQKGEAAGKINGSWIVDYTAEFGDFADTAAFVANLDLVITVCTSVAHLAGTLGVPTWTMLRFAADWRWLENRADSPWYPTMRLFRQTELGDWSGVVNRVADALQLRLSSNTSAHFPTQ